MKFEINNYRWKDNGYEPEAWGELKLTDSSLTVKLTAKEGSPLGRIDYGPDAPVCRDSCLEFFFSLNGDKHYINLEMNSVGGFYCGFRTGRSDVTYVQPFTSDGRPNPKICDGYWYVEAVFDVEKLKELFSITEIESIRGNFYKCGDQTELPHYGMWNPVETENPDFHRPEFFKEISLDAIR